MLSSSRCASTVAIKLILLQISSKRLLKDARLQSVHTEWIEEPFAVESEVQKQIDILCRTKQKFCVSGWPWIESACCGRITLMWEWKSKATCLDSVWSIHKIQRFKRLVCCWSYTKRVLNMSLRRIWKRCQLRATNQDCPSYMQACAPSPACTWVSRSQ